MTTPPFGVLFDIDDTLVDFAGAAQLALLDVAHRFGPDAGEPVLAAWAQVSEREYERFLAGEVAFDQMLVNRMAAVLTSLDPDGALGLHADDLERLRNEAIFNHYAQYEDVRDCLARFSGAGVPIGVVSNSDGDYQRRKMIAAGLDELIDGAVFSGDLGVSKPDPAIFRAGAAALGLPPERVLYVGDRWATDAIGALSAGLAAIWLNRLGVPRPDSATADLGDRTGRLLEVSDLHAVGPAVAHRLTEAGLG